jgi:hypothetical protein
MKQTNNRHYNKTNSQIEQVRALYRQCVIKGNQNPYQAAHSMDSAMGGLTRVDYDPNKCLRLYNHMFNVGISPSGLRKRQQKALDELVVTLHGIADQNQGGFERSNVSVVRLDAKGGTAMSTKHHKEAYTRYQQHVQEKYAA